MRRRENNLIDEIERGALDSGQPLADALRKCVLLGGKARSAELRDWASRELNGYDKDDELPDWRIVAAPILVDSMNLRYHVRGVQISPWQLPDFARDVVKEQVNMGWGVGQLEAMLGNDDEGVVKLGLPEGSTLVAYMNHKSDNPYENIERIYWAVSTTVIRGVLDRIRTALAELVAELRHGMPEDADLPTPDLATQAVQVAVGGKNNRVFVAAAHSDGEALVDTTQEQEPVSPGWRRWAKIGTAVVGAAAIMGAIFTALQFLAT